MEVNFTCEPCKEREIDTSASKYCVTCQESQCKECAEVHKSYKTTRKHLLVQMEDWQVSLKLNNELKELQMCEQHTEKLLEFYCTCHKVFLCSTCLLMQTIHMHCSEIINLSECLPCAKSNIFTDKICNDFDKTILQARFVKEKLMKNCENTKGIPQQISDKLDSIRDTFLRQFEEQKAYLINSAEKKVLKEANECNEMMDGIHDLIRNAEETENFLKEITYLERDSDTAHCILLSIERIKELKKRTEAMRKESTELEVFFENSSLTGAIEKKVPIIKCNFRKTKLDITNRTLDITSKDEFYDYLSNYSKKIMKNDENESGNGDNVGGGKSTKEIKEASVNLSRNKPGISEQCLESFCDMKTNTTLSLQINQTDTQLNKTPTFSTKLKCTSKVCKESASSSAELNPPPRECVVHLRYCDRFDIKDKEGLVIWISGIVCLHDDRLVLSDYPNMRLIALDTDRKICKLIPFKHGPRFLSLFSRDMFMVCLSKRAKVTLVKVVDDDIRIELYLNTRFYPKAAHKSGRNTILVTMQDGFYNWHVDIIDLKGEMIQTVNFKDIYNGYKSAVLMPKTQDSGALLIQYCESSNQVHCLTLDGKLIFNYDVDDVSRILTDQERGNIFISRYCGEVLVLTSDGKLKGSLKKGSMFKANFMTMNSSTDKLYITTYKEAKIHSMNVVYKESKP